MIRETDALGAGEHLGDVVVGDEPAALGARDDDRADRGVALDLSHERRQLVDHAPVDQMQRRVVEKNDEDAPVALGAERRGHR